jgi:adenylate cyclase
MGRSLKGRFWDILVLLALLAGLVAMHQSNKPLVKRLNFIAFDYYNRLFPRDTNAPRIMPENGIDGVVIVDIDEASLQHKGQFPWPRVIVADLVDKLAEMQPKSIAFDIVFAEEDWTSPGKIAELIEGRQGSGDLNLSVLRNLPDHDDILAETIRKAGNVVTSFVGSEQQIPSIPVKTVRLFNAGVSPAPEDFLFATGNFATTIDRLASAAAGNGSFTLRPESDGVIRRMPMLIAGPGKDGMVDVYPSLPLEALRVALGRRVVTVTSSKEPSSEGYGITDLKLGDYHIPIDQNGHILVYYSGHHPERYIPAWEVLDGKVAPEKIKNKIVMIGTSAEGLKDMRSSPLDKIVPGVEIHAEILEQILAGQHLERSEYFDLTELVTMIGAGLLMILLAPFVGTAALASLGFLILTGISGASLYMYQQSGMLIDPVYPAIVTLTMFMAAAILSNLRTEHEKRFYREAFGHYISEELMKEVLASPEKLALGGEERELSVMFTDVRNFTSIAETMPPDALIKMMNDFLTPMTSAIMAQRGTIDKYMGDAIMAFWNAPVDVADHPRRACLVALEMLGQLDGVNEQIKKDAKKQKRDFRRLDMGIGLSTGLCSVGNMGSKQRFAYSAIGDSVNLAARLEGQTKTYKLPILLGAQTAEAADDLALLEIDLLTVKGRTEPERIFTLLGDADYAATPKFQSLKKAHDDMLKQYRAGAFKKARDILKDKCVSKAPKHLAEFYAMYLERIENYIKNPPQNWTGVYVATGK